jgi:general secretion pathway protein D
MAFFDVWRRKIAGAKSARFTRRALLKTTAKALAGWIAVAIVLWVGIAAAGPICSAPLVGLAAAVVEQSATTDDNPSTDVRQKTVDLLRRARQAMAENDVAAADSLISQAESLGIQYGPFYMGDTPKKARRDLDRKRNSAGAAPTKPSQMFAPFGLNKNNKKAPTTDPFAGRPAASAAGAPEAEGVASAPKVDAPGLTPSPATAGRWPMQPPTNAGHQMIEPGENEVRGPVQSQQNAAAAGAPTGAPGPTASPSPLRAARLALAVGDVRRAAELVQQAKGMRVNYQPLDDTPERVEAAIAKYQELSNLDKRTEAYRRAYARNMMDQGDALMRWGEPDEAERLASRAAAMQIVYGPFEQKPQDLLERIASVRRQGGGRQTMQPPSAGQNWPAQPKAATPPTDPGTSFNVSATPAPTIASRQQAVGLVHQAREAIAAGQLDRAESLARAAEQLRLPDSAFAPGEDRPGLVLLDLRQLRLRESAGALPAGGGQRVLPAVGSGGVDRTATHAVYEPNSDRTRNMVASAEQPGRSPDLRVAQNPAQPRANPLNPPPPPDPNAAGPAAAKATAQALFEQGEAALRAHEAGRAYELFRQAATRINELDPVTAQRLQDHLQLLSVPSRTKPSQPQQAGRAPSMADEAAARQQVLARQVAADLAHKESSARAMRDTDPKGALAALEEARKKVESSGLDSTTRDQLLRRVDRAIAETKQFMEQNRPQLEAAAKNNRIRQDVERQQKTKVEVGEKLALLIDEFNKLMDEQEYEKAEVVAKRAAELDPDNPVVVQVLWQAKFVRRFTNAKNIADQKEEGFVAALGEVDKADIPFAGDKNPLMFGDAKDWQKLTKSRAKYMADHRRQRSEREIDIEKKLRTPVSLQFTRAPLSKVLENLAKLAEVNLHLDPQGMAEEGVTSDTPVTIELRNEIMLKSALNLILEPLHLSYVIKDEVLKITSEQMRDGQVYRVTYNVADLVVPIPNFVPTPMGLQSAYQGAMANVGFGGATPFGSAQSTPLAVVASRDGKASTNSAMLNPNMLAQVSSGTHTTPAAPGAKNPPAGAGPGGLGGGAQADFDSLIDLITSTVRPTTWDTVGGPGSIAPFETNLSLVISQTQEVHEEIADLLEQMRRLQDLQVTIEVRFITLNDSFFERIGVSFDFDINTNVAGKGLAVEGKGGQPTNPGPIDTNNSNRTAVVGMGSPTTFSSDLDIPFTQGSYGLVMPQFGGFDPSAGATLGFAILSDIEAYFFVQAAQGDTRSNVLQAPKITLFNGQQASISDTSQSPFVISVIPVVGDFAAAQQPVIVVLSEGTFMTVQAVVSNDRRFVRLTVVPFFSKIGEVREFKFTGSETTTTDTTREGLQAAATDPAKLWNRKVDNGTTTSSGTTVQLPTFSFVSVTTTVSVPDGGTVLLGGIKRLSEDRKENGVPLLNKLPYINRLFQNVGIGRQTQSLMMMVTPRIIIQEEEEEKIGIPPQP